MDCIRSIWQACLNGRLLHSVTYSVTCLICVIAEIYILLLLVPGDTGQRLRRGYVSCLRSGLVFLWKALVWILGALVKVVQDIINLFDKKEKE